MITLCWAAKGGSGTTVIAAALALTRSAPTLLVDLAGDQPIAFGVPDAAGPGLLDWIVSSAPVDRLRRLEMPISSSVSILPAGQTRSIEGVAHDGRWQEAAAAFQRDERHVVVDVGTTPPPAALYRSADHRWIVTRPCYLALRAAARFDRPPNGIVLITEPGRALKRSDVEVSLGAPVVIEVPSDPAIARAVDAGLLVARLPRLFQQELRSAA